MNKKKVKITYKEEIKNNIPILTIKINTNKYNKNINKFLN